MLDDRDSPGTVDASRGRERPRSIQTFGIIKAFKFNIQKVRDSIIYTLQGFGPQRLVQVNLWEEYIEQM